jgi:hypothetical protein
VDLALLDRVIRLFAREVAAGHLEAADRWAGVAFGLVANWERSGHSFPSVGPWSERA